MHFIQYIYICILVYIILSFYEWFLHKHLMHTHNIEKHLDHHLYVNDDMSIRDHHGMSFEIKHSVVLIILISVSFYFVLKMCSLYVNYSHLLLLSIFIMFIYKTLWDYLHYKVHQQEPHNKIYETLLPNSYIHWAYNNHIMHHKVKGDKKGNYNIILPLFDHIMGTYNSPDGIKH